MIFRNTLLLPLAFGIGHCIEALPQLPADSSLRPCGNAYYHPDKYTCYNGSVLCPVINGQATLRCNNDCYLPDQYSCNDGRLGPTSKSDAGAPSMQTPDCQQEPTSLHLSDPPYDNYFYSDCRSASQVVVTTPLEDSNLTIIGPRLLVAWPAGNSGLVAYFAPQNGINGSLGIALENGTNDRTLSGIYQERSTGDHTQNPKVGITTLINFNSSASLVVPILGSVRTIRDFTEGPSILVSLIQDALNFSKSQDGSTITISRLWLDNQTTSSMQFRPHGSNSSVNLNNHTLELSAGTYNFTAWFDYPQLTQLSAAEVLNNQSQGLITSDPDNALGLSFLSYSEKLLAGAWRFLTYFGRDSMISLLLMQPILSEGEGGAVEAVISAVLERVNVTDGSVCHEETIGDYATYLNLQKNITSTSASCAYPMVDTDYYLPIVMESYFLKSAVGQSRRADFLAKTASLAFGDQGKTYAEIAVINAEKVMNTSAAFAQRGGQTKDNLIHLKDGQIVGQWRDSTYGIGGGRIPYDVNTALVPAALRAIAALSAAGLFFNHSDWNTLAAEYAQVWEDETLQFFAITVPQEEAKQLVDNYTSTAGLGFPSTAHNITSDISYHGLALDGNNNQSIVKVMNTDDCFRHFLLNTTNQTQLTRFVNQTATNINLPYPAGLSLPVGLLVANPAYGGDPVYAANFSSNFYHGTVVWSWQLAMMAKGLERQISRCTGSNPPDFCADESIYPNVLRAYNRLWDIIDDNKSVLSNEVWSWIYQDDKFRFEPLGALAPPPGVSPTESNVRQLWSLSFLAVKRNETLKG